MGTCQQCKQQTTPEIINVVPTIPRESKSANIRNIIQLMNEFDNYIIIKTTQYSFLFDDDIGLGRQENTKTITTQGTVKPINLSKLRAANEDLKQLKNQSNEQDKCMIDKKMVFQSGLELGDTLPSIKFQLLFNDHDQVLNLQEGKYTLIKSWSQGEQMVNFEHAIDLIDSLKQTDLQLIGLARGNIEQKSVYEELVRSNHRWENFQHIYICTEGQENLDNHILDIYFQENTNEVEEGFQVGALLFYGTKLIWKRYNHEWDIFSDSEEVAQEVTTLINKGVKEYSGKQQTNLVSSITKEQYCQIKKFVLDQQTQQPFTRKINVSVTKRTFFGKNNKTIVYDNPIIDVNCSPKSQQITESFIRPLGSKSVVWDGQLLKKALTQKIQSKNLNIEAALERQIKIQINYEKNIISIPQWESSALVPYYKSTLYISQVKQWIHARDEVLSECESSDDPVTARINKMIKDFFTHIPTVERIQNQQYGKIPYAEKRKPPYEEMSISKSLGNEEITRKQDKILLILLIDYENDDTLELLKSLIKYKKENQCPLQIAVLGHIRAESWTKLFQAFMEKHKLNNDAEEGVIETWFPVEDKIGSITFSAILSKMYNLVLEKRDCMLVDLKNQIRVLESSRRVIPKIHTYINDLQNYSQNPEREISNYRNQYSQFKKCIRKEHNLKEITTKIKQQCKEDDTLIMYEQKKSKVWDFENGKISETRKYSQPTKILRLPPKSTELDNLNSIISKYIESQDILQMK
ncbi:unnamed protein product (macronuclear) [Paramecium tetraurelia]|uniref:Uncharacterized protein n=1 Tax=Paramecium tetraurelia TaxID=5888 RepID=A0DLQ1_PARTE|nr:uncharacterized protein GSPATT00039600001 [Paramecium tetraurelia]CAK83968.1 unnamed protein product [Paramecium tetraurelia]|eukprot:XP_001451365.1 hypothetical protein (macronuclear) [Paramecium tetraurelia strain d4-2]